MFESSNSIIFILLLLILVYFIKKHFLVKQLEENYQNLRQGHLILTPSKCKDNKDFVILENKMLNGSNLLEPKKVKLVSDTVTERKLTSSTINNYCSKKSKGDYPDYSKIERKKTKCEIQKEKEEKEDKEDKENNSNTNTKQNILDSLNLYIHLRNKSTI